MNSSFTQEAGANFVCPLCNTENRFGAKFCRRCGVSRTIMISWGAPEPIHSVRKESETSTSLKPPLDELDLKRKGLSAGVASGYVSAPAIGDAKHKQTTNATSGHVSALASVEAEQSHAFGAVSGDVSALA